jgi:outer membrane receptor protein involved in Fe transport
LGTIQGKFGCIQGNVMPRMLVAEGRVGKRKARHAASPPEKLVHTKEFTMQSKYRAIRLALLASIAASGMAAAQTTTDQPATGNQPAPASTPSDQNVPADNSAAGTAGGTSAGRKKEATEEIVVTGSRIRRKDLTTPAPVTVISREQVTASGKVSIGDFLQALPEQGNAINTQFNNGGDGATRISLRGLGSQRTLVLLNGRRMVPGGTGADASVDLNSIPTASVERIEVLKDGASAVYGSDAIAGVVNIITRKGFKGTEASAFGGVSQHGDGQTYDLNVTTGQASDRGNVVFSAGYYKQQAVFAGDRDFSRFQLFFDPTPGAECPKTPAGSCLGRPGEILVGSGTIPAGRFILSAPHLIPSDPNNPKSPKIVAPDSDRICDPTDPVCAADPTAKGAKFINNPHPGGAGNAFYANLVSHFPKNTAFIPCVPGDTNAKCFNIGNGQLWRPYSGIGLPEIGGDQYNFQPQNYNVTPAQRISLYSIGDLSLGSNARGYYEASFVNRQSEQLLAAEPLLTDGEGVVISADNLYNPFGRDINAERRRLLEFGNRKFNQDISTFRVVGGIDGTLPEEFGPAHGWFWDLSLNFGRTEEAGTKNGNVYLRNLAQALGPSMTDPKTGAPICVAEAGKPDTAIPGCVPLNLFGGAAYNHTTGALLPGGGTITPDQVAGLTFTGVDRGINQMTAVQANTSGELFSLFADRPVGLALGYEYRLVYGAFIPDPITVAGETSGNKGLITKGGYHVNEGYAELSIPILSNVPFAENVEATAAARVFNYSTFGSDWTYKFGGRWSPIHDVTLRGTYSTAFRAPSVGDLFGGQADNFAALTDPCRNLATAPPNCGVAAGNGDDQTQLRSRVGGNPKLTPETAKVFTAGVVLQPSMVRGFSMTVDYYNFNIENAISAIGESVILNGCYPTDPAQAPRFCNLIQRDPTTHRIVQIFNLAANVGGFKTDGIDVSLRYALPTDYGRFGFIVDGTWLHKFDEALADGSVIHGRGVYDLGSGVNGGVYPAFKANGGVTFGLAGLNVGVSEKFIGSYWECADDSIDNGGLMDGAGLCNQSQGGHADAARKVSPYFQTDVYASYGLNTGFGKTTLAVGLNNAFNVAPPVVYNAFTPTSDPSAYDFMGRFFWGRLTQTF